MKKKYDIAAYVYPAYSGDDLRTRLFWPEGSGEWQSVKNAEANSLEYKPEWYETWKKRKPLWGYVNEANPDVMQMQIDCAVNHGVNVFIYDWYWFDNRPYLENCLNDGFLQANNNHKMKFYIMWANHDATHVWDYRYSDDCVRNVIWQGTVDRKQFEIIGRRWIDRYFTKENYYRIDDKPVVSIYSLHDFVIGLGGAKQAADALNWLRNEAMKAGLPGVHVQFIRQSGAVENLSGVDSNVMETGAELIEKLGFDSLTHYQFCHFTNINRDYNDIIADVVKEWGEIDKEYHIPYYPHVSVGWDNNPRWKNFRTNIVKNNTPQNFELALRQAKAYVDTNNLPAPLITINSWNEWTETSYLEPDELNGYGYLEAVKRVFIDE